MAEESSADMLSRLGDDGAKWAAEFRQTAVRLGYSDMDEGWLIGWFSNAIEHSGQVRRERIDSITLPCDVILPPNTIIRKGCNLSTLLAGMKGRAEAANPPA